MTANIANGANVAIGTVAYDTADVTGETAGAGGTVQFYVEKGDATCSVDGATDLGSKALGVNVQHHDVRRGRHLLLLGRLLGRRQQQGRHERV